MKTLLTDRSWLTRKEETTGHGESIASIPELQGTSLDDPSRTHRTQLAVKAGGQIQEPVFLSNTPPVPPESPSIQIVVSQGKGSMVHSESFPSAAKSAGAQVCLAHLLGSLITDKLAIGVPAGRLLKGRGEWGIVLISK